MPRRLYGIVDGLALRTVRSAERKAGRAKRTVQSRLPAERHSKGGNERGTFWLFMVVTCSLQLFCRPKNFWSSFLFAVHGLHSIHEALRPIAARQAELRAVGDEFYNEFGNKGKQRDAQKRSTFGGWCLAGSARFASVRLHSERYSQPFGAVRLRTVSPVRWLSLLGQFASQPHFIFRPLSSQ